MRYGTDSSGRVCARRRDHGRVRNTRCAALAQKHSRDGQHTWRSRSEHAPGGALPPRRTCSGTPARARGAVRSPLPWARAPFPWPQVLPTASRQPRPSATCIGEPGPGIRSLSGFRRTVFRMGTPRHRHTLTGAVLAGGAGVYCAATLIGLYLAVTGVAWNDPDWVAGAPGLLVLGLLGGVVLARRRPGWPGRPAARRITLAGAGMLSLPLAAAVGSVPNLDTTASALLVVFGAAGAASYLAQRPDPHDEGTAPPHRKQLGPAQDAQQRAISRS